jgi:ACS family pantothenate transporter-like MFS transporter
MFILDAIIGIPIAVWGFWAIPDLPHTTKAFYFTGEVCQTPLPTHRVQETDNIGTRVWR